MNITIDLHPFQLKVFSKKIFHSKCRIWRIIIFQNRFVLYSTADRIREMTLVPFLHFFGNLTFRFWITEPYFLHYKQKIQQNLNVYCNVSVIGFKKSILIRTKVFDNIAFICYNDTNTQIASAITAFAIDLLTIAQRRGLY